MKEMTKADLKPIDVRRISVTSMVSVPTVRRYLDGATNIKPGTKILIESGLAQLGLGDLVRKAG